MGALRYLWGASVCSRKNEQTQLFRKTITRGYITDERFLNILSVALYIVGNVCNSTLMEQNRQIRRVHAFLESLALETNISKTQARLQLAKKISEKSLLIKQRRKIKERLRALAKNLETKEAEIQLIEQEVQQLQIFVDEGTDDEED